MSFAIKKLSNVSVPASVLFLPAEQKKAKATVVCMHGFPDCKEIYQPLMQQFAKQGFDVWAPAMPGYEPESARQQPDFYPRDIAETVIEWIEADLAGKDIHVIGHDWGSPIASLVVAYFPQASSVTVKSFTSLAIPPVQYAQKGLVKYPEQIIASRYIAFFQLRGIAEWRIQRNNFQHLIDLSQRWSPTWDMTEKDKNKVRNTMSQPGVLKATLQYYRRLFDVISKRGKQSVKEIENAVIAVPSLFLSGVDDTCMSTRHFSPWSYEEKHYPAGAEHEFIAGGHFCPQEAPEEVAEKCLAFWAKNKV